MPIFDSLCEFKGGAVFSGSAARFSTGASGALGANATLFEGGNYWGMYVKSHGTSERLLYGRLYLLGASASGEAGRFFTTVEAAGAVGVHGVHASVSFGAAGTCTGQVAALRGTLHVPSATLGGTNGAIYAELYADGVDSDMSNGQFARFVLAGNATGAAKLEDSAALFSLEGGSIASGNIFAAKSSAAVSHVIRIKAYGTAYYLMVSNAV